MQPKTMILDPKNSCSSTSAEDLPIAKNRLQDYCTVNVFLLQLGSVCRDLKPEIKLIPHANELKLAFALALQFWHLGNASIVDSCL